MEVNQITPIMKYITTLFCFLLILSCEKKPPEPKDLYEKYRSAVVLIRTDFYHVAHLENGNDIYFKNEGGDFSIYDDLEQAQESPMSITGTGFFISDDGKIATNRHVAYPNDDAENFKFEFKSIIDDVKSKINEAISEYKQKRYDAVEYHNEYYDYLSYERRQEIKNEVNGFEDKIVELDDLKRKYDIPTAEIEIETILHFIGIVYDNTHVNRFSDFDECVLLRKSEDLNTDLAIIQTKDKITPKSVKNIISLSTKDGLSVSLEDKVYMIGYNKGLNLAYTGNGIKTQFTSGTITQDPDDNRILYSIPTLGGSSGSPILNQWGELVAVNFAKTNDFQGFSFGVPASKLSALNDNKLVVVSSSENRYPEKAPSSKTAYSKPTTSSNDNIRDFSSSIRGLVNAEDDRNLNQILTYFDYDIKRYWSINNPSRGDLINQYEKSWELTTGSNNTIKEIIRHTPFEYTLKTSFNYYDNKKRKSFTVDSRVFFKFNTDGKIEEVYGVD